MGALAVLANGLSCRLLQPIAVRRARWGYFAFWKLRRLWQ